MRGSLPGEITEREVGEISPRRIGDQSMHLLPTSSLLRELRDACGVAVTIISVQVQDIPQEVRPGLSEAVRRAVPAACD